MLFEQILDKMFILGGVVPYLYVLWVKNGTKYPTHVNCEPSTDESVEI